MAQHIKHTSIHGDRWDLLAWQYYGDATRYAPIIDANRHVPVAPVLHAGIEISIPILGTETPSTHGAPGLPSWVQAAISAGDLG